MPTLADVAAPVLCVGAGGEGAGVGGGVVAVAVAGVALQGGGRVEEGQQQQQDGVQARHPGGEYRDTAARCLLAVSRPHILRF